MVLLVWWFWFLLIILSSFLVLYLVLLFVFIFFIMFNLLFINYVVARKRSDDREFRDRLAVRGSTLQHLKIAVVPLERRNSDNISRAELWLA